MNFNLKQFMDFDTTKVLCVAAAGIGGPFLVIDLLLKTAISIATLFYICLKIRRTLRNEKNSTKEKETDEDSV